MQEMGWVALGRGGTALMELQVSSKGMVQPKLDKFKFPSIELHSNLCCPTEDVVKIILKQFAVM